MYSVFDFLKKGLSGVVSYNSLTVLAFSLFDRNSLLNKLCKSLPLPLTLVQRPVHEAHSRQNSSVQDVTQAVSRTTYVMDMKQRAGFFFHDTQFFLYALEILKLLFFSISESSCMSEG